MILTVTLNPAIDKILILNNFELHKLHRLEFEEMSLVTPGGKGVNIAHNLNILGNKVVVSGFAGGHSGHMLCDSLRQEGITTNFIFTTESTRTNTSILDRKNQTLTEINDFGQKISEEDMAFFLENYERLLNRVKLVVIAGSLPPGLSEDVLVKMVEIAREHDRKTIIHTLPQYTENVIQASPFLFVPDMRSHHEILGKTVDGIGGFLKAGRNILMKSPDTEFVLFINRIENVVAITRDKAYIMRPIDLSIVNMLGYGDAYLAGFIHAWLKNSSVEDVLRYASAAGLLDVEDLYKEIRNIEQINKNLDRIEIEIVD